MRIAKSATVLALAVLTFWPSSLFAHAKLVRSEPAAGDTLTALPHMLRFVFSEVPEVALSRFRFVTAMGDTIAVAGLRADPADSHALLGDIPSGLSNGAQRILWAVAASDGHATHGVVEFTLALPFAPAVLMRDTTTHPDTTSA